MRKTKHYALLLIVALAMFSCGDDYDDTALKNDISDLKSRVEKLESWCNTANTQISALQGLVSALQENDYVTGVTPIMEGAKEVGYTITFAKAKPITILNGKDGEKGTDGITPIIGVKQDTDGVYYWTVKTGEADPVWLTDAEGKKINAAGKVGEAGEAGHTPVISVETSDGKLYWKVDDKWLLDKDGNKVPATGEKGATGASGSNGSKGDQGDSIFKKDGIDISNDDYVTFTLTDGTEIKLMRALDVTIGIKDVKDEMYITSSEKSTGKTTELELPSVDDYKAITAEIKSKQGVDTDIATRAADPEPWKVELTKPVLNDDGTVKTAGTVKITPSSAVQESDQAILTLSIIDKQNIEHTTVIIITYTDNIPVTGVTLGKTTLALEVGGKETLTATVLPDNAQIKTVTWSSSHEAIAKVSSTGEVEGLKAGTATITVTTTDGSKTATCEVTVSNVAVTGVSFSPETATVSIGATITLKPVFTPQNATDKTGTWKSSDETKATVDNTGKVTGVAEGTATITFTSTDGNKTATCTVTVNAAPAGYAWYRNPTDKIYTISTAADFIEFAKLVNKDSTLPADLSRDNFSGKTVQLSADIDLGNQTAWQPVGLGNGQYYFKGTFDGKDKEITGTLTAPSTAQYFGIFGNVDGGEIKNLHFRGTMDISALSSSAMAAGAIAGMTTGLIINCSNTANLTNTSMNLSIGGIVGVSTKAGSKIIACVNKGEIVGKDQVGGISGSGSSGATIVGCINKGSTIKSSTNVATGGIASLGCPIACWSAATSVTHQGNTDGRCGAIVGLLRGQGNNCYWKAIGSLSGYGDTLTNDDAATDYASFTGDAPSAEQITKMNTAWATVDADRKFQFNATTGKIEAIPAQ